MSAHLALSFKSTRDQNVVKMHKGDYSSYKSAQKKRKEKWLQVWGIFKGQSNIRTVATVTDNQPTTQI